MVELQRKAGTVNTDVSMGVALGSNRGCDSSGVQNMTVTFYFVKKSWCEHECLIIVV